MAEAPAKSRGRDERRGGGREYAQLGIRSGTGDEDEKSQVTSFEVIASWYGYSVMARRLQY